ncbi:hypothetical protein BO86DRAFT_451437 [Aspergillus japonicus CBS 114.51]|uniref:5'-3' DNA helicase ZGRF1-like N-terminal domain-containing protein n=1 Tax=Aspergillus japonicus CBS 114.51 TaxID=1448312 RepID=A0A8T8WLZ2_ASPJA|nr:hypothetical protein BO86DRAFT_451437 [Aspergillus japonicus CBS 114.51]RAH76797.1 hypothetical protein BO86DRAFT_451437 [Aspergillus japonicus CBS 114.51]
MTYPSTPTPTPSGVTTTSPTFTTPLTQNTAPVIKHRCLFTHDTRRKAKRWQDGYLRYHTFNKRVMAYDTSGNFIGDLHWRQDAAVQDGDELELDRGVLVQVCEAVGRSETDLGAVLSHSHGTQGSVAGSPLRMSGLAGSQPQPQQSMRSLNDLLGIRKTMPTLGGTGLGSGAGTSGLAATRIMQGPDRGGGEWSAVRAAKRQRVDCVGSGALEGRSSAQQHQHQHQQVPSRRVLPQPVQPRPRPAVVDLTGSSTASVSNSTATAAATATATYTRLPSHDLGRQTADSRTSVQAAIAKSMSRGEGSTIPSQRQVSRKENSTLHQQQTSRKESSNPPPQPQATRQESSNPPQLPSTRKESTSTSEEPPVLLRLSTSKPRKKLMYSALLPNGGGQLAKPASLASASAPALAPALTPAPSKKPAPAPAPPRTNKEPPPPAPPAQPPTTTTPPKPHDFTPSTSTQTILNDLINVPPRIPPLPRNHTAPKPNPNPRPNITHTSLRKSYSDPTALTTTTAHRPNNCNAFTTAIPPDPADPFDQGPWTREALDLFDFWPAGRAKPV